jgi:transcriptional regulator of nitric oxide reductase
MVSGGREMSVEGAYVVKMRMVSLLASHRVSLLSTLLLVAVLQFTYSLVHRCRCISEVRRSSISDVAATFL